MVMMKNKYDNACLRMCPKWMHHMLDYAQIS